MCNRCKLADPDWPFRYGASLAARLPVVPPWWQALIEFAAARHHPGGAVAILRHAGRVISAGASAGPRQILAAATRHDQALNAEGRALDAFFTSQQLILPGDQASRRAAARRQRYLDAVPAAFAAAVAAFNDSQLAEQDRARRASRHQLSDITLEARLRILRDLAGHLAATGPVTSWGQVSTTDLESFLAARPRSRHQDIYMLRRYFAWARQRKLILIDPARPLRPRSPARLHRNRTGHRHPAGAAAPVDQPRQPPARAPCRSLGISLAPAHPAPRPTNRSSNGPWARSPRCSPSTWPADVGASVERRGKNAEDGAAWSMAELQALLDEWIVTVWQNRPHDGLRDPLAPGRALTPNERYAALIDVAGYVPVPLSPDDYIELLPAAWRVINSYGVKIGLRTYDSGELNPYRRQHSGIEAQNGRWEARYDPYDISRIWIRNHHHGGWLSATWKHLRTAPVPFGEQAWNHARQLLDARGSDPATEAEIAAAAADLLDRAGKGPGSGSSGQASPQQEKTAELTRSARSRRVRGRTAATAAPQWPRPAGSDEDCAGPADDRAEQAAEAESELRRRR